MRGICGQGSIRSSERKSCIKERFQLFGSIEAHTRESVQLNGLARNFAQSMDAEAPVLDRLWKKFYVQTSMGNEFVAIETYRWPFVKLINNKKFKKL